MSEEGLEPTETMEEVETQPTSKLDELPEWAKEEILKTRREAAGRRVTNKEQQKELDEYRKWKEEQKSEADRLLERATKAEQDLAALQREKLQRDIAAEVGLDPKLANRILGNSEDEMREDALELAETAGKRRASEAFTGSAGGNGVVRPAVDTDEAFRRWINSQ